MQINKIIMHKLKMELKNPFQTSFGTVTNKVFFILEVVDKLNRRGYGESVAFTTPWYTEETTQTNEHIITDFLIKIVQRHEITHPEQVTSLFAKVRGNNMAKAAVETAIWDLYAKQRNITLSEALGGQKEKIDVGISIGMKSTIDELLETIEQAVQQGFKRIKLKIAPGNDINIVRNVRTAFPELPLMVDANSAYTLKDAEHLKKLDQYHLMMIEQPLAHDDIVDHAKLQKVIDTPICLDESIHSLSDVQKAVELGSCQIINVKIGRVGGINEAKRIHDYCQDNNIDVWCGGMLEAGVGRAHNIALSTLSQFNLPGDLAGSSHYWEEDIIHPEVIVQDGVVPVPQHPGIGYNINFQALQKYTIARKTFHV